MSDTSKLAHQVRLAGQTVRSAITNERVKGARKLLDFAEAYAITSRSRDEAVVMQLESKTLPESAQDHQDLVTRMIALVDLIIEEHTAAGPDALLERDQALARVREYYQRIAPPQECVFEGRGIRKQYSSSGFTLGTLDLRLRLGEITGVVGQNAHGKTTLLRMIAGELQPDEGTIGFPLLKQERRIDWAVVKQSIAFISQELPPWSGSLADTLHFEAALHGIYGTENKRAVDFIVERLGLRAHMDKPWGHLSGGYKLRFALARALVWKPRLLVLDEPLANLDVKAKGLLLQDIRDLARSYSHPIAVIMSSHDLHNLESVCNQMVFLVAGEVKFVGPAAALGQERKSNEYEIGTFLPLIDVRSRLADTRVTEIREEGLNLVLNTDREYSYTELLRLLIERDIDVHYFRDNSRSIRRLFD